MVEAVIIEHGEEGRSDAGVQLVCADPVSAFRRADEGSSRGWPASQRTKLSLSWAIKKRKLIRARLYSPTSPAPKTAKQLHWFSDRPKKAVVSTSVSSRIRLVAPASVHSPSNVTGRSRRLGPIGRVPYGMCCGLSGCIGVGGVLAESSKNIGRFSVSLSSIF